MLWLCVVFPFICFLVFQRWVVSYWQDIFCAAELLIRRNEIASALERPSLFSHSLVEASHIGMTYNYLDTVTVLSGTLTECFHPAEILCEEKVRALLKK